MKINNNVTLEFFAVPNEEPKSPVFKTFPQSATVTEGEAVNVSCQFDEAPLKGNFFSIL